MTNSAWTWHRPGLRVIAATIAATLLAAACGSGGGASSPGVTSTSITIGSTQPLTGPAAPGYSEIAPASNAYFQWVNDHGGVDGRKIVYKYLDDGYNPANTTSKTRQLVLQDKVFALFSALGTPTHLAVVDYVNSHDVPDIFVSSGCNCWNDPSKYPETFGWQTDYTIEGKILGQYLAKQFPGKKFGYFVQNDEFGQDGIKGLDQEIQGSQVVSRQTYDPTNTDVTPQVSALQSAGADVVVCFCIPAFTTLYMLTAAKLGYQAQLAVSNVGSDLTTLTGLLKTYSKGAVGPSLLNGLISDAYLPPPTDSSDPWIQLFDKIRKKYTPKLPMDGNVEYGMAEAYAFVQALQAAGKDPTRDSLVSAIEAGKLTPGAGLTPYGYSSDSHLGFLGVQIDQIANGQVQLIGSVQTSSDTGAIKPYSATPETPPPNGIPS
ncbi:MAG TPA: ABC transporter substrate-binding protein [Actinomycetota bacterium]|jgi:ABC-type branched-subunit amino acid transport system substrate-binding protein